MLRKPTVAVLCSLAIGLFGLCAPRAEAKDSEVKDGVTGKVVTVDVAKGTVTIADSNNRERTYSINEETVIVGPRGGVVHSRLKDHRFHSGLPITVVANGTTAAELHLGYDRKAREMKATAGSPRTRVSGSSKSPSSTPNTNDSETTTPSTSPAPSSTPTTPATTTRTSRFRGTTDSKRTAGKDAAKDEEEDEDSEFPGKVKSFDPARRMLVISLVNGKDRSFLLSNDVKILVNSRVSRKGLSDPALQAGAPLTVITEVGGRKVKEVKVNTAVSRRVKKAA
ncbi:MAG TPA: hypothetical protein VFG04_10870 [Planctomycetaceae bacterium]|jgi:hypothetical protein|nr:hypothetical protein [Planctomycetaceae bacterium]